VLLNDFCLDDSTLLGGLFFAEDSASATVAREARVFPGVWLPWHEKLVDRNE
jgi:hypothetical protein